MGWHKEILWATVLSAGTLAGALPCSAQTFQSYRCADGTRFVVGFYQYDPRAYMQIDGGEVILNRRPGLSGSRYSGGGITLQIGKATTTVKHLKRPVTACELS